MIDFFDKHFPTIATALLGLLAWGNEKNKRRIEIQKIENDSIEKMQNAYKIFVSDMNSKYADIKEELELVRLELEDQRAENKKLKQEIESIRNGVHFTSSGNKAK